MAKNLTPSKLEIQKRFEFSITDNTTYTGIDSFEFYSAALTGFPEAEYVTIVPNVKSKIKLPRFDLGNILVADDCNFSGAGEGTLSQKAFEVCDFKINLEYCSITFEQNFLNTQIRPGSKNTELPASFENYMIESVAKKSNSLLETVFWVGDTGTATYPNSLCDGLIKKLNADALTGSMSATSSTISSTNIIGEMNRIYNAIPVAVRSGNAQSDVVFFLSSDMFVAYVQAQATAQAGQGYNYSDAQKMFFLGHPVVEAPGIGTKKAVVSAKDNLLILTDLMDDKSEVRIIPQYDKSGAPTTRVVARMKFSPDFHIASEIVYYK